MIRVIHFRRKCIGCNACVEANRDRWRISRVDGKSILIGGVEINHVFRAEIEPDEYVLNMKASRNCPVKIIKVENVK